MKTVPDKIKNFFRKAEVQNQNKNSIADFFTKTNLRTQKIQRNKHEYEYPAVDICHAVTNIGLSCKKKSPEKVKNILR